MQNQYYHNLINDKKNKIQINEQNRNNNVDLFTNMKMQVQKTVMIQDLQKLLRFQSKKHGLDQLQNIKHSLEEHQQEELYEVFEKLCKNYRRAIRNSGKNQKLDIQKI